MALRTIITTPTGTGELNIAWEMPPPFTVQPAAFRTLSMWFANAQPSVLPMTQSISTSPFGSPESSLTSEACCGCVRLRGRIVSLSSSSSLSALAVISCCLAKSVSTFCCAALAFAASFWSPATLPSWAVKSPLKTRLSCSNCLERSSALAATPLASWIRASASAWTASWTLFPESQTSQVRKVITIAVNASAKIYMIKARSFFFVAASTESVENCAVFIVITIVSIAFVILGILAVRSNNMRMDSIRRRYCNTKINKKKT